MHMNHTAALLGALALPFVGSVLAACLPTNARNAEAWLAGAIAFVEIILVSLLYPSVTDGGIARAELEWIPLAGLNFVVRMDGFAWLFALLIAASASSSSSMRATTCRPRTPFRASFRSCWRSWDRCSASSCPAI